MRSENTHTTPAVSAALIVGCGFLGRCLARKLLDQGTTVWGTTRHQQHARELAAMNVRPLLLDITQPVTLAALAPVLREPSFNLFFMVPPGRNTPGLSPRQILLQGQTSLLRALNPHAHQPPANLHRAILVSSTAVYGPNDNQQVDADTPPSPADERAQLLLEAENLWLARGQQFKVLRLAGLYGSGRIIGLQSLHDGAPLVGNPQAMLNLIHVEDAAELLIAMTQATNVGRVELGSDGSPAPRLSYYQHLAQRMNLPQPRVLSDAQAAIQLGLNLERLARTSSKVCDPSPTIRRTGWTPRYANYRVGLEQALSHADVPGT